MAKGAKKLDEATENEVTERLAAVRRAKTLDELCEALRVLPRGDAGYHAMRRLQPPFKTFGGAKPTEEEQALSWDATRLLVVEESLDDARIVPRRGVREAPPASGERPAATNDAGESPDGAELSGSPGVSDSRGALDEGEATASEDVDPGADPIEVVPALEKALKDAGAAVRKVTAERLPGGKGRVVIVPKEGPKTVLDVPAEQWAGTPAAIARGVVESMGGEA